MSGHERPYERSPSSGFQVIIERPDQPAPSPPSGEPAFRPRRYHTKSRNGCFNCKRRRIKCDEAHPECSHCWEKGLQCEYPQVKGSPQPRQSSLPSPTAPPSRSRQGSEVLGLSDPRIKATLDEDDVPCDNVIQQGYHRSDVFDLLHHFVIPTEHLWIGSPNSQGVMQDHVRRNAANAPYLLYSALAFAAAHRHHLSPNDNKYRVAAPYHYQHSLQKYFEKLNNTLAGNEADSLLVSCQLHASLAFLNAGTVHSGGLSTDLGWVRSMRGVRFITQSPELMMSLAQGRFHEVARLAASDWTEICEQQPRDDSPRAATDLRQVELLEQLTAALHPDQRAALAHTLSMLRDLASIRPDPGVIEYYMIWINRQPSAFVDLLQAVEPVALLTMGLWCALFGRIDEWWIVASARAECHRICAYVEGLGERRFEGVVRYLRTVSQ